MGRNPCMACNAMIGVDLTVVIAFQYGIPHRVHTIGNIQHFTRVSSQQREREGNLLEMFTLFTSWWSGVGGNERYICRFKHASHSLPHLTTKPAFLDFIPYFIFNSSHVILQTAKARVRNSTKSHNNHPLDDYYPSSLGNAMLVYPCKTS